MRVRAAADGWRAAELKALPLVFWERFAELLGACEEAGTWPEPLRVGVVADDLLRSYSDPLRLIPIGFLGCTEPSLR